MLNQRMIAAAGKKHAPAWAIEELLPMSDETKWPDRFWPWLHKHRNRLPSDERNRRYVDPDKITQSEKEAWHRIQHRAQMQYGHSKVRSGQARFSTKDIMKICVGDEDREVLQAALPKGHTLNSVSLGRWLQNQLVDAPIEGLVMRYISGQGRMAYFWIEYAKK
jgi:hypothetical protein